MYSKKSICMRTGIKIYTLKKGWLSVLNASKKTKFLNQYTHIHKVEAVVHGRNMAADILQQKQSSIMLLQQVPHL